MSSKEYYTIKKVKTDDFYDTMLEWWEGHKFAKVSREMLPETTFVYYVKGKAVYSTCFYNTDSGLCWVGWQLSDPNTTKEHKESGLERLFNYINTYARGLHYSIVFTTSNTPIVEENLVKTGSQIGDTNVNHYIKIL